MHTSSCWDLKTQPDFDFDWPSSLDLELNIRSWLHDSVQPAWALFGCPKKCVYPRILWFISQMRHVEYIYLHLSKISKTNHPNLDKYSIHGASGYFRGLCRVYKNSCDSPQAWKSEECVNATSEVVALIEHASSVPRPKNSCSLSEYDLPSGNWT